jgi:hypothetical protein
MIRAFVKLFVVLPVRLSAAMVRLALLPLKLLRGPRLRLRRLRLTC